MKNLLLQRRLNRIQRDGNDDLLLILECGPRDYPTFELHQLLRRVRQQTAHSARIQHLLFLVGASISLWIGAGFLCAALGYLAWGYIFLALIPTSCLLLISGHIYLRRKYRTHRHGAIIANIIQQELERRRKDASIF